MNSSGLKPKPQHSFMKNSAKASKTKEYFIIKSKKETIRQKNTLSLAHQGSLIKNHNLSLSHTSSFCFDKIGSSLSGIQKEIEETIIMDEVNEIQTYLNIPVNSPEKLPEINNTNRKRKQSQESTVLYKIPIMQEYEDTSDEDKDFDKRLARRTIFKDITISASVPGQNSAARKIQRMCCLRNPNCRICLLKRF